MSTLTPKGKEVAVYAKVLLVIIGIVAFIAIDIPQKLKGQSTEEPVAPVEASAEDTSDWQGTYPDGSKSWIINVKPNFSESDLPSDTTLKWHWKEVGIAVVASNSDDFSSANNIESVVPDLKIFYPSELLSENGDVEQTNEEPPGFSPIRYQWGMQAVGVTRPDPTTGLPVRQISETGSGIKVGNIDSGFPTSFSSPDLLHPDFHWFDPSNPEQGGVIAKLAGTATYAHDVFGHGTPVASIIAADSEDMMGVAPEVQLYSYSVGDLGSSYPYFGIYSNGLLAFKMAIEDGVQIINNETTIGFLSKTASLEQYGGIDRLVQITKKAIQELQRHDIIVIVPAGNWNFNLDGNEVTKFIRTLGTGFYLNYSEAHSTVAFIPQEFQNVLTVGGTSPVNYDPYASDLTVYNPSPGDPRPVEYNLDIATSYEYASPYGVDSGSGNVGGSGYGTVIDVVAPYGRSNLANGAVWYNTDYTASIGPSLHGRFGGTSASIAYVAGIAALAAEAYNEAYGEMPSHNVLINIIKKSADDQVGPPTCHLYRWDWSAGPDYNGDGEPDGAPTLRLDQPCDTPGVDKLYGHGRINAKAAVDLAKTYHDNE